MQALFIILISILLSPSSAISSALPSSSSLSETLLISPSINNLALPTVSISPEVDPEDGIACFNLTTHRVRPVNIAHCNAIIDIILHDPSGALTLQNFSHNQYIPGTYAIPKIWEWGQCFIILTSEQDDAVGEFRLVDVIIRAQDIIAKCPPNSKAHLGGVAVLGVQTFFVGVDGPVYTKGANQTMQLGTS